MGCGRTPSQCAKWTPQASPLREAVVLRQGVVEVDLEAELVPVVVDRSGDEDALELYATILDATTTQAAAALRALCFLGRPCERGTNELVKGEHGRTAQNGG